MMQRLFVACLVLLASVADAAPGQSLRQLYHTAWTVRDGVPSSLNEISWSPDGWLWMASDSGLFRFDGVAFQRFEPTRGDPLPRRRVQEVKAQADGSLWISYPFNGASHYDHGVNKNYGTADGLPNSGIRSFATDGAGTVWAVANNALVRFDGTRWQKIGKDWNVDAPLFVSLLADRDGTLWVGTSTGVIYLRKGTHRFEQVAGFSKPPNDIAQAPDGTLWLACRAAGVWAIDPVAAVPKAGVAGIDADSQGLHVAADGSLWISTVDKGLLRLRDPDRPIAAPMQPDEAFERMTSRDGMSSDFGFTVVVDGEGGTWVATAKGIDHFRPSALSAIDLPSGSYGISVVPGDGQGVFAAATSLARVVDDRLVSVGGGPAKIQASFQDPAGHVWLGAKDGVWEFADGQFVNHGLPDDLRPGVRDAQSMVPDPHGGMWVSMVGNGVRRWFDGAWSRPAELRGLPPTSVATVMLRDAQGRTWFGMVRNRLFRLDGDVLRAFDEKDGVAVGDIESLQELPGGLLIGGQSGLQFFDGRGFRTLALNDGGLFEGVSGIVRTARGDLWLNQSSGVIHIEAAELARALKPGATVAMKHRRLDQLDGLTDSPIEHRPLPTAVLGADGRVWIATRTGLFWIDPEHLHPNAVVPPVRVTAITADGERTAEPTTLVLKPRTEKLEIDYTALSLPVPQRVKFRYRLDGFDRDWQDVGGRRQAFYPQLPPGRYAFHVVAANDDGLWNEAGAQVAIELPPSFTQSTGFKLLCGLAAALLLWGLYTLRVRHVMRLARARLQDRLAERERLARDLHDSFLQKLQALLWRFGAASDQLGDAVPAKRVLDDALRQSDALMLEGRDVLHDLRQPTKGDDDLARALRRAGDDLAASHTASFDLQVDGEIAPLDAIVFDEAERFAGEALANAFRHAQARHIVVTLHYAAAEFRVTVADDGVGLPAEVMAAGFRDGHWGLPGMRERARVLHAAFDLRRRVTGGTEVELRVPGRLAYATRTASRMLRWRRYPKEIPHGR